MEIFGTQLLAGPDEIVERARAEIHAQGINLLKDVKPTHNNIMVTCISHGEGQENKPSLGISLADKRDYRGDIIPAGTCHCFACGYSADLPTFISNLFGYNDAGAFGYKWIMKNFVAFEIDERPPLQIDMSREVQQKEEEEVYISEEELQRYRYTHPYMYERKLTDKIINYFDVGFDHATNALTFPVHDLNGRAVLIQRRAVEGKSFHNDVGTDKGRLLYGLYQVYRNIEHIKNNIKEIYIVESPIDALTLWVHGIPAVALMQARPTPVQIALLIELPIRKLIIATDNDTAGHEGAERIKRDLGQIKLLYRLKFPAGAKDINVMTEEQIKGRQIEIYY